MKKHMKNELNKKYDWPGIFLWSLVIIIITIGCVFAPTMFNFDDTILSLIQAIILMTLGIFAGLVYKNNTRSLFIIENSFLILLTTSVFLVIISSAWLSIVDPVQRESIFLRAYFYIRSGAFLSIIWLYVPFSMGYMPAIIVRFFSDKFFQKQAT